MKGQKYSILVIWNDGSEDYVCEGKDSDIVSKFNTRKQAQELADFMRMGMEDFQSISVVKAPK